MTSKIHSSPTVIIVMGVSGAGKTRIGELLARRMGWGFADADSYHSQANIEKMKNGIPLTDEDRKPWLAELGSNIQNWIDSDRPMVLACSALKDTYRKILHADDPGVAIVFLEASKQLLLERLDHRQHHFMKADLLESQLSTLEKPTDALTVDAGDQPEAIVRQIRRTLCNEND